MLRRYREARRDAVLRQELAAFNASSGDEAESGRMAAGDGGIAMDRIRRGDIWTVSLPAFPRPRPALIVSIDPINDLRPDILVIPITTHSAPLRVPLPNEPDVTGLRELSHAKCESVGPLHKSQLKARIGRLPADAWPAIESGLARVLGIKFAD